MKIVVKKVIAFCLVLSLVSVFPFPMKRNVVTAVEYNEDNKIYCSATIEDDFTDNEVLIVVTPDNSLTEYTIADFSNIGCVALKELSIDPNPNTLSRIIKLTLDKNSKQNVLDAIYQLELREDIYSAEPNYLMELCQTPNDPEYTSNDQWAIDKILLPVAWDVTTGSSAVRVGVIDTGIDASHPDLTNVVDRDLSCSFTSVFDSGIEDIHGHGTMVAGIIAAQGNNGEGIVGSCWNVKLVSLRVATEGGNFNVEAAVEAIEYAESKNIPILNFSGGGYSNNAAMQAMKVAIQNYNGLFVCAAGNNGTSNDSTPFYPANYDLENIISVGGSTTNDERVSSSNAGQTSVDIFAPGSGILTCYPTSRCTATSCASSGSHHATGYHINGGTSLAAPFVAGVAALLKSYDPDMSAVEIKQRILSTVDIVYDSDGNSVFGQLCVSGGRLNAAKALHYSHQYTYTPKNSGYHFASCSCGHTITEAHSWTIVSTTSIITNATIQTCVKCGYHRSLPE